MMITLPIITLTTTVTGEVAEFYERQLVKVGVRFVREHRCLRLWQTDEDRDGVFEP